MLLWCLKCAGYVAANKTWMWS